MDQLFLVPISPIPEIALDPPRRKFSQPNIKGSLYIGPKTGDSAETKKGRDRSRPSRSLRTVRIFTFGISARPTARRRTAGDGLP